MDSGLVHSIVNPALTATHADAHIPTDTAHSRRSVNALCVTEDGSDATVTGRKARWASPKPVKSGNNGQLGKPRHGEGVLA